MELPEDLQTRMFTLKKRLREVNMDEIFESGNKSIIEVYNRQYKKAQSNNLKDDSNSIKKIEVKKSIPTLKVIKELQPISKPSFVTTSNKEQTSEKIEEKEETHSVRAQNTTEQKLSNGSFAASKLHTLLDKNKNPNEISQFKDTANSSSSEKNRDIKKNSKQTDKRSHKPQVKLQPLPANNLLNMDQWQNSEKFPLIKTNQSGINSTINNVKKELMAIGANVANVTNKQVEDAVITVQNAQAGQDSLSISNTNHVSLFKSETKQIEFDIINEVESKPVLPAEEKNQTVDDSFYDQKEELFTNNLPPEVMGGSPEFQKDEEMQIDRDEEYNNNGKAVSGGIFSNKLVNLKSNVEVKYTSASSINLANSYSCNNSLNNKNTVISTKITIPNTFNNETVLNTNFKTSSTKKNAKIIDDDDEEESAYTSGINVTQIHSENQTDNQNACQLATNLSSSKIKILLTDFKTPLNNECVKSVKSWKSAKSPHENFEGSISTSHNQNLNNIIVDSTNKSKDSDNKTSYDRITLDKRSLKDFTKKFEEANAQSGIINRNEIVNKKFPPSSDSDSQKNFEKKLNEMLVAKKGQMIDNEPKLKSSSGNKISNTISAVVSSNQAAATMAREKTKSSKDKPLLTDKKQEPVIIPSSSGLSSLISSNTPTKESLTNKPSIQPDTNNSLINLSNTTGNNPLVPTTKNPTINEIEYTTPILSQKIEKKNNIACFIISMKESATKLKEKMIDSISKNQNSLYRIESEFETIENSILNTMCEDSQIKGIRSLSEKFAKLMLSLLDLLKSDELLEKFNMELVSILETANDFFKKNLTNINDKPGNDLKIIKSTKSLFKFLMNLFRMKGFKNKISQIVEAENYMKENKKSGEKNINVMSNLLRICKSTKSFNRSVEKMNKILLDIKDEELKNKKKIKNAEFPKIFEKIKEFVATNPNCLLYSKFPRNFRNFYDLIFNYLNED